MSDLISRDAMFEEIQRYLDRYGRGDTASVFGLLEDVTDILADAPAVDAAQVVHARWAVTFAPESTGLTPIAYCTACKRASTTWSDGLEQEIRYCFFCGAKMDGGDTDG